MSELRWFDSPTPPAPAPTGWYAVITVQPWRDPWATVMLWSARRLAIGEWVCPRGEEKEVVATAGPFPTEEDAVDWAYEWDPC